MPAPAAVKRLVDHFVENRKVFLSGDYKEEQLRHSAGHQAKVEEKPVVRKAGGLRPAPLTLRRRADILTQKIVR